jgi:DNA-directed RNA polymerase subunit M/transcription elongation factor TFIIS
MSFQDIKAQINNANKFKSYCIDIFGKDIGAMVQEFYKKTLTINGALTKQDYDAIAKRNKKSYESSNEKYFKHISFLVENYSKEAILAAIKNFKFKQETGSLATTTMNYFAGFVENEFNKKEDIKDKPSVKVISEIRTIIPVQSGINNTSSFEKAEGYKTEIYYWSWKCSCGETNLTHFIKNCPKCGNTLDWIKININPNFL